MMRNNNNKAPTDQDNFVYNDKHENPMVPLSSLTIEDSILGQLFQSKERKAYVGVIVSGFIWIFMFLISLLSIFLIFKTPYFSYYEQTSPYIVGEQGQISNMQDKEIPKIIIDSNGNQIKEDDDSKMLISRPNDNEISIPAFEKSIESDENNDDNTPQVIAPPVEQIIENKLPDADKKPSINNNENRYQNKVDTEITKILKSEQQEKVAIGTNTAKPKKELETNTAVEKNLLTKKGTNIIANTQDTSKYSQKVWLVTLYSSNNKNNFKGIWSQLKASHGTILDNVEVYLIENIVDNKTTYRISVARKMFSDSYGNFATQSDAKDYCKYLQSKRIDCFVTFADYAMLSKARMP